MPRFIYAYLFCISSCFCTILSFAQTRSVGNALSTVILSDTLIAEQLSVEANQLTNKITAYKEANYRLAILKLDSAMVILRNIISTYTDVSERNSPALRRVRSKLRLYYEEQVKYGLFVFRQKVAMGDESVTLSDTAVAYALSGEASNITDGMTNLEVEKFKQATKTLDTAITILQRILKTHSQTLAENRSILAQIYTEIGRCYSSKLEYEQAITYLKEALQINIEFFGENHIAVAKSYSSLAFVYTRRDQPLLSLFYQKKSLDIERKVYGEESLEVAFDYWFLGQALSDTEEHESAIAHMNKALSMMTKLLGDKNAILAHIRQNLANVYQRLEDYDQALVYNEEAMKRYLSMDNKETDNTLGVYMVFADVYRGKKDYKQAIHYGEKAVQVAVDIYKNYHYRIGQAYSNLAVSYAANENYEQAFENYEKSLEIDLKLNGEQGDAVANTYRKLGDIYGSKKEVIKAINYYQKSLKAIGYQENSFDKVAFITDLAKCLKSLGDMHLAQFETEARQEFRAEAYKAYLTALDAINYRWRIATQSTIKQQLSEAARPVFEALIQMNNTNIPDKAQKLRESFDLAERSRALLLYEFLQESKALQFAGLSDDLLQQEEQLRLSITLNEKSKQDKLNNGFPETETSVLAISDRLFDLNEQYSQLKKRFETDYPEYYRLKYDLSTISAEDVQRELLQPNQALLEYFVGDSSIFVFVIRQDTLVVQEVKKDFPLEDWVKSLRDNIYLNRTTGAVAYAEAAYNLYQKLVLPVKSLLPEQVIIIPDGILGYVPFEALLTAKPERAIRFNTHAYLLKEHQISYCYSATLLREMQQKKSVKEPTGALLAVAPFYKGDTTLLANLFAYDETTRKDLSPLQHSGEEVYRISKLWKGNVLTGGDATEEKFTKQAGNYRILHLATHGRADERVGDYSFLAFSEIKDSVENELLYVRDLYNLQLNADLVVLSACETGLGKLSRGEGIISLARAFAYAGAKSIVTTLWSVDDAKTKDVMVDFYRKLKKGMTKDQALRQAKLDYLKSHTSPSDAHPYYWAGFAPIGDMRALR